MRRNGSKIASMIDMEYKTKRRYALEREYIREHCSKCINKDSYLCDIRQTISGDYKCTEYKEENTCQI